MKVKEKLFSVELTEEEVDMMVNALHEEYLLCRADYERDGGHMAEVHMNRARSLRNDLAVLIDKAFYGQDA